MPYATWTATKRNLQALRKAEWSLFITPDVMDRLLQGKDHQPRWDDGSLAPYALDNGAWGCFQKGKPFDFDRFAKMVEVYGSGADFICAPDVVEGGLNSLAISLEWVEKLKPFGKVLIPVQDGMMIDDLRAHIGPDVGIAVGGSTEWKETTTPKWGKLCAEMGAYLHVLRVNTCRRIAICAGAGADSFDGTSATRFSKNVPRLNNARKQLSLLALRSDGV
jgi:hypothetical protein